MKEYFDKDSGITVQVYESPLELVRELFEPDAVEVGWNYADPFAWASIDDKTVYVWMPPSSSLRDWVGILGHECGHIVTGGFADNPPEHEHEKHEEKADHYEAFTLLVFDLASRIMKG